MRLDNFENPLSPENSHSNSNNPSFLFPSLYERHALLSRGRRRSRRLMTEQGAAADNACRDGAPRGARASSQEARAPRDPHHPQSLGSRRLGVQPGRSQGWPKGADRKAPWAPPGAPSLSYGRGKENRETGHPGARKTSSRDGGALAESHKTLDKTICDECTPVQHGSSLPL